MHHDKNMQFVQSADLAWLFFFFTQKSRFQPEGDETGRSSEERIAGSRAFTTTFQLYTIRPDDQCAHFKLIQSRNVLWMSPTNLYVFDFLKFHSHSVSPDIDLTSQQSQRLSER